MKLKNIFKKKQKNATKAKVQTLNQKQLEKVVGGGDNTRFTGSEVWNQPL